jgi:hypothetical protein
MKPSLYSAGRSRSAKRRSVPIIRLGNGTNCRYPRLLLDTGRAGDGIKLDKAALATHETTLGRDHPWTRVAGVTADALEGGGRSHRARYNLAQKL